MTTTPTQPVDRWAEGRRAYDAGAAPFDCPYIGWQCWRWMAGFAAAARYQRLRIAP